MSGLVGFGLIWSGLVGIEGLGESDLQFALANFLDVEDQGTRTVPIHFLLGITQDCSGLVGIATSQPRAPSLILRQCVLW